MARRAAPRRHARRSPRPPQLEHELAEDLDAALQRKLEPCANGERALVFCNSRGGAERTARKLKDYIAPCIPENDQASLKELAERILHEDPEAEDVVDLLPAAVAYHQAGLPKPIRRHIEQAFRDKLIRVIASTPTLAAGVNLPATSSSSATSSAAT